MSKRGYRSPRNVVRSMMERGAIITPEAVHDLHPDIDTVTARLACQSLVKLGWAREVAKNHYEQKRDE